jgi:NitT/TauT family transport system substrate-binding protein
MILLLCRPPRLPLEKEKFVQKLWLLVLAVASIFSTSLHAQTDVSMITDFGYNGRHSYFYVALDKGFYKEEGMNVTILRGQGSGDAIKKVAAGAAMFGFADAGSLVLARGNDGVPVKLVSVVYLLPPQALFVLDSSNIKTPKDLEGKTLAETPAGAIRLIFPAYAKAAGIDESKVKWVAADSAALPSILASKRADAIGQFLVGEPLIAAATAPEKVRALAYKDVGLSYYGNGIIAAEQTIASNPALVKGFVRATIKGMKEAFANPKEAAVIMNKYQKQLSVEVIEGETRLVEQLAVIKGQPMGKIDPARIDETVKVMSTFFTLNKPVNPADIFADGFVE